MTWIISWLSFFNNILILSLKPQPNQIEYGDPEDEFKGDVDPRREYVLKDLMDLVLNGPFQ